jgi:hypothetical protein
MWTLEHGTASEQAEVVEKVASSLNWTGTIHERSDIEPYAFSVERAQKAVAAALASKASARDGAKWQQPLIPTLSAPVPERESEDRKPRKGPRIVATVLRGGGGRGGEFDTEANSSRRDNAHQALCASCGSPNGLKACGRCKKIWYCGVGCQR